MELDEIKSIVELMQTNDLALFELEHEGFKIKLQRQSPSPIVTTLAAMPAQAPMAMMDQGVVSHAPAPAAVPASAPSAPAEKSSHREIVSPMVGTFYSSPSPESASFVKVGQEIDDNTTVCIVEAMKVMNEIKAELRGTVVEVLVESGKPVQFGQPLFRVK